MKFNEFPISKEFIYLKIANLYVYLVPTKSKIANLAIWRPPSQVDKLAVLVVSNFVNAF